LLYSEVVVILFGCELRLFDGHSRINYRLEFGLILNILENSQMNWMIDAI